MDINEDELVFKRFPAEKQDQVRGLVNYATLMGLTGKDLVSIGGKLDRLKVAMERKSNMNIIAGYECLPIGQDRNSRNKDSHMDERFRLKTAKGSYKFESDYSGWKITSSTAVVKKFKSPDEYAYQLGNVSWRRRSRYSLLLDISAGKLVLDF